ncbi:MAG: alpha/beta fold hydrolase [Bacteroidota bacterium]|nr:alpha/beta fold hydrolase [Bacteroidota bacterium]
MKSSIARNLFAAALSTGISACFFLSPLTSAAQTEGDYVLRDFTFASGEKLPELRLHYTVLGRPMKDSHGHTANAVLIMHGTTGDGHQFLSRQFAGGLFGKGQLLDTAKYFIILPDAIGHGKSSKPSNGLHMRFPKYTYDDMVRAQHLMLTEHLGVDHLRLVMGTSMGGMQTWVWGTMYPDFMDALMPLASLPVAIAGRNRMQRKMAINMIEMDPAWNNGEYSSEPRVGLSGAISSLIFMVSSPWQYQRLAPTREQADSMLTVMDDRYFKSLDANDMIYQLDASRFYDPSPHLAAIRAPLYAVNSADDQVNPPELGILDREIKKVAKGKYILLPITEKTTGHGTHSNPAVWGEYLKELLAISEPK